MSRSAEPSRPATGVRQSPERRNVPRVGGRFEALLGAVMRAAHIRGDVLPSSEVTFVHSPRRKRLVMGGREDPAAAARRRNNNNNTPTTTTAEELDPLLVELGSCDRSAPSVSIRWEAYHVF